MRHKHYTLKPGDTVILENAESTLFKRIEEPSTLYVCPTFGECLEVLIQGDSEFAKTLLGIIPKRNGCILIDGNDDE